MDLLKPSTVPHQIAGMPRDNLTILLYGGSGAGKTAQLGELAEYYYKQYKLRTRLYYADPGGYDTIAPYVSLGIIEVVPFFGDAFIWIDKAVKGMKLEKGVWVPGIDPTIGLYAYEGATSMSDKMMDWMSEASSRGINIGGGGAFNFVAGEGTDKLKIGSSNMAHYGVAQQQIYAKMAQSQNLPGAVMWTAGDSAAVDDASGGIVGPQFAGKAKTSEGPRAFKYTFRIAAEVAMNQPTQHVLYTDAHLEVNAKMAKALSNARAPLSGTVSIPSKQQPASLVGILQLLSQRQDSATDAIKKRLGL